MTVYACTKCEYGKRCLLVTDQGADGDGCPQEPDRTAEWLPVDDEFAEALLLGVAEQERRRFA